MDRKFVVIILLSLVVFTANIGGISIYVLDEAKNSVCAREMFDRDSWVVPTFNNELRTDKPPLHYYFMMFGYTLFGVNEFAARFFSALMGVLTVLVVYGFAKRYLDKNTAFYAALALLASVQVVAQFHLAVPDPYLIFFVTLGLLCFYAYYKENRKIWIYGFYTCLALATLAKGPVAVALPGLIVMLFLLWKKALQWRTLLHWIPIPAILLFLVITLPWYIAVGVATDGEWLSAFFLKHNLSRYADPMEGHGGPFFLIPLFVITGLFPFSLLIVQALHFSWKHRIHDLLLLAILVVAVITVFFSFSGTKLPNYPAPAFPFLAIVLGYFLGHLNMGYVRKYKVKLTMLFYLLVTLAIPIAVYIVLENELYLLQLRSLSYFFLILSVGAALGLFFLYRHMISYFIQSVVASWIITTIVLFYIIFPQIDRENPVNASLSHISPDAPVAYYKQYNPAFSFYIRKPISALQTPKEVGQFLQRGGVVISREKYMKELESVALDHTILHQQRELFEPRNIVVFHATHTRLSENKGLSPEK